MKLKNYVLYYAGNRIQAAYVPTDPANTLAACLFPLLGDAVVIVSREHMQFGVQIFIWELLTFPGNGIPKLISFSCLFRTYFTNFRMILNVNWQYMKYDHSKHLIGRFFSNFLMYHYAVKHVCLCLNYLADFLLIISVKFFEKLSPKPANK